MKEYAMLGLMSWYKNMIPALLPFMILTSFLIQTKWDTKIVRPISFILNRFLHVKEELLFVICVGFLCGFPMGSKVVAELYSEKRLTKNEAQYLLCFTNNMSPAYFFGYVCPIFYKGHSLIFPTFVQFGIPLLYGLLLRYTLYQKSIPFVKNSYISQNEKLVPKITNQSSNEMLTFRKAAVALDNAIQLGMTQITSLGGYMIVFNVLVFFPKIILSKSQNAGLITHLSMEVTGGLEAFNVFLKHNALSYPMTILIIQSFLCLNGLCCLFQTIKFLKDTNLSIKKYMLHKGILCSITIAVIMIGLIRCQL